MIEQSKATRTLVALFKGCKNTLGGCFGERSRGRERERENIYISIYAVMFDNGVFFFAQCVRECFRSCVRKWGAPRTREGNPYFLQCFVGIGGAAVSAAGLSNIQRCPGAPCPKWGIFQQKIRTMTLPPTPSVETSMGFTLVRRGRTCPELRWEWVLHVGGPENSMKRPKSRDLKKWPKIFVLARPSSFCAFCWRAWLSPKTGFWKSSNFRWNHCKRSAKWSRLENPFLHGGVWNRPILQVPATSSRNISPWIGTSFPTHLPEEKLNCFIFLAFSLF